MTYDPVTTAATRLLASRGPERARLLLSIPINYATWLARSRPDLTPEQVERWTFDHLDEVDQEAARIEASA